LCVAAGAQAAEINTDIGNHAFIAYRAAKLEAQIRQTKDLPEWFGWAKFDGALRTICEIALDVVLSFGDKSLDNTVTQLADSGQIINSEQKNYVTMYSALLHVKNGLSLEEALNAVRQKLLDKKAFKTEEELDLSINDTRVFLQNIGPEEILKGLNRETLLAEKDVWEAERHVAKNTQDTPVSPNPLTEEEVDDSQNSQVSSNQVSSNTESDQEDPIQPNVTVPDYTKTLHFEPGEEPPSNLSASEKQNILYGYHTTHKNYVCKLYNAPNGTRHKISEVAPAKTIFEIFQIPETTDMDVLLQKVKEKLASKKKEKLQNRKTEVTRPSNESTQDAAIRYAKERFKVCVLNLADGTTVGGGTLHGGLAQEEINMHCTAGLRESLHYHADSSGKYAKFQHSPEFGLLTKDVMIIKNVRGDNKFYAINNPVKVDVISMAAVKFEKDGLKPKPNQPFERFRPKPTTGVSDEITKWAYDEIRQRVFLIFAMAILSGADVLVVGPFASGLNNANPKIMSSTFQEVMQDPLINDQIPIIVLVGGGKVAPYSDFAYNVSK
jgi:uncharacterized protein (TIGR02452 family)